MARDPSPSATGKSIEEDEIKLFRDAVGAVRPVTSDLHFHEPVSSPPIPAQTQASEASVADELLTHDIDPEVIQTGEELSWLRPGQPVRILKQLRRGHYSVGAVLDLHHMNREAARASILQFLDICQQERIYCARIIHGKGLRSRSQGPVIKSLVNSLLKRRSDVVAFVSARPQDGGTGAVYVLLSRS